MKILHIEAGRNLYGGAQQVLYLMSGLASAGIDNVLACPVNSEIGKRASALNVGVVPIKMGGDVDIGMTWRIASVIKRVKPDLLHVHSRRGADIWGGIAARLCGVPAVLSRRVDNPESRLMVALKYRLFAKTITISEGIRRVLLAEGLAPDKVVCVHSAVDTDKFSPAGDTQWLRQEFNLQEDAKTVGMIAQFIERKGHRTLLEAIPSVLMQHPETHFLLFGQGPLVDEINQLRKNSGLEKNVHLCGFRNDLDKIIPSLDLVAHPAAMEGLGVALLQSAACAVPIVAGNAGGIPEIVRDEVNGYLVEPTDPESIAAKINELLAKPELAKTFGAAGRELALSQFSIDSMVRGNLITYSDIVGADL